MLELTIVSTIAVQSVYTVSVRKNPYTKIVSLSYFFFTGKVNKAVDQNYSHTKQGV